MQAIDNIKQAARRTGSIWEERVVIDPETMEERRIPILDVTTKNGETIVKSGYLTHDGRWATHHEIDGKSGIYLTGQRLDEKRLSRLHKFIQKGLKDLGLA